MNVQELNKKKVPLVKIDPKINELENKVLFPKKLALAEKVLKKAKFPKEIKVKFV